MAQASAAAPYADVPVRVENITVSYGETVALQDFSLDVCRGETVALLGPSGSGKSTALKAIAGFETPDKGRVLLGGTDVTYHPPNKRGLGVVVQSYALFPHLRVRENIAFGLRVRRMPQAELTQRVAEVADLVGMRDYLDRLPGQLSGGQQQRVAIARALAIRPPVLLLDEPLSALDARLREDMVSELQRLRDRLPDVAMVYVTHDQGEALALADRIAVMRASRCETVGPAHDLYESPPSQFAATFLGGASLLPLTVMAQGSEPGTVRGKLGTHVLSVRVPASAPRPGTGSQVTVAVRPWAWSLAAADGANTVGATVRAVQWRGATYRLHAALHACDQVVQVDLPATSARPTIGDDVLLSVRSTDAVLVPEVAA